MADTERLMNKAQGDDIISALATIAANILQVPSEKLIIDWSYTTLPASGNDHTIYAIPTGDADDPWDFYVWNDTDEEWVQFDWNFAVDSTLSTTSENPVQNKVVTEALNGKVDKVEGKGLSTNDYTNDDKASVANSAEQLESTQTVSGNPLTLTDAAPINAESLVVELEPKQDLHGQSAPYVGGAGKNKLPMTVEGIKDVNTDGTWSGNVYTISGVTFTILTDSDGNVTGINANGTASADILFYEATHLAYGNIVYNGCPSGGSWASYCQVLIPSYTADYGDGASYNFTEESSQVAWIRIASGTSVSNKVFYPMVRLSTETDPTFAPYSNICPISGYEGVEVEDVGVNQWDEEWELGDYNDSGEAASVNYCIRSKQDDYIPVLGNTVYYAKCSENIYPCFYDINKTFISKIQVNAYTTFTTPANARYMRFVIHGNYGTTYNHDISINYPSTDTDYHPHQSRTASVTFGQTVYGGRSNFTEGGTEGTKATETITSISARGGVKQFYITISGMKSTSYTVEDAISNEIPYNISSYGSVVFGFVTHDDRLFIRLPFLEEDTIAAANNWLANNPLQLCYELATPDEISTPPTDLKLLKGTNNITTNGTTITIGYQPDNVIGDVKGEIEKCAVDAEFMQFSDGTDTFTDVNLSLDASLHTVSVVGSKIEQKRFICFEVMDKMGGVLQGILASCIAFTDGAKTPSGTAFRAYIESLQMYVNFRIYGSASYYTLAYQSESSFSASAFYVRVRMMNNL